MSRSTRLDIQSVLSGLRGPLAIGLVVGALMAMGTLFVPNRYRSEVRILPSEPRGGGAGLGQLAAAAASFGVAVPGQDGADISYVDILNSRWLRENLLGTRFRFHVRRWYFGGEELRDQSLSEFLRARNMDRGMGALTACMVVGRDLKSKMLTLSVETSSPELSQQVARHAVSLLEKFLLEKSKTRGGIKVAFTDQRLLEARAAADQSEGEFRSFLNANRNYLVSPDPAVRLKGTRLEAELRLHQQLVTTLALNREQALLEEKNDMPILNVLDGGNLPVDKSGPARSVLVAFAALFAGVASWAWLNRELIGARLLVGDETTALQTGE